MLFLGRDGRKLTGSRVVKPFALIIPEGDTAIVMFDDVVWVDRDFTTTTRAIDDVLGDSVTAVSYTHLTLPTIYSV